MVASKDTKLETAVAVMQRDIEYLKIASDEQKKTSGAILHKIETLSFVTTKDYLRDMKALTAEIAQLRQDFEEFKREYDESKPGIRFSNILENKFTTFIAGAMLAATVYFLFIRSWQ